MIKIVTDTTASLSLDEYKRYDITAVPLYIRRGETAKKEVYEISYDEFYHCQRNGDRFTTSQPNPGAFLEVFRPPLEAGDEVICITISNGISGTINSANVAKNILNTDKITIFDSYQSGFGQASLAIKAATMAAAGASRAAIVAALEKMRANTRVYFVVESLRYLYEGGRLSGAQALIGSLIQVKPIIWFDEVGKMTALEKIRTLKAAKSRVLELVKERVELGVAQAGLHYGDNFEEAVEYAKLMKEIVRVPVPLIKISPVIASHTGPDLLGPYVVTEN